MSLHGANKENQNIRSSGSSGKRKATRPPFEDFSKEFKQRRTDPLVHYGRHFGRSIRTFCRMQPLLRNCLGRTMQLERLPLTTLSCSEIREQAVYDNLLEMVPGLEEKLNTGSEEEVFYVAEMLTKGISSARSDDTKGLKSVIVDWITPPNGVLNPPIQRNIKTDRGYHHPATGRLLCPVSLDWERSDVREALASGDLTPSGDLWPRFLYKNGEYIEDDPWNGLLRSALLVKGYKHVFTSPSSVYKDGAVNKATRSSNARRHGMKSVTPASIAYIATQVRFALSSSAAFTRTDATSDSEYFYNLLIELLEDPEEQAEVQDLLTWWNQ
ncbi:hypothetical protein DFP72DRAFT_993460 [Ephemerocybe angulata]|uniref:Uncharacterized protein n=1 Tax=Ephemerocybe angulata TaxID=980116 RepID=A0A8H6HDI2_9AGAR|nr:hypothetical protein DFP72DRAFT_993460 [Tulosesus angulatus]